MQWVGPLTPRGVPMGGGVMVGRTPAGVQSWMRPLGGGGVSVMDETPRGRGGVPVMDETPRGRGGFQSWMRPLGGGGSGCG